MRTARFCGSRGGSLVPCPFWWWYGIPEGGMVSQGGWEGYPGGKVTPQKGHQTRDTISSEGTCDQTYPNPSGKDTGPPTWLAISGNITFETFLQKPEIYVGIKHLVRLLLGILVNVNILLLEEEGGALAVLSCLFLVSYVSKNIYYVFSMTVSV